MRWMNLEPVIQSEVSQKEKNKNCILTQMYESQKNGTDDPICRTGIETQTQRPDVWTQQGKERVGHIERVALKHIHSYVKQIASGTLLCNMGSLNCCSVTTQRGAMGLGVGQRFKREGIYEYLQLNHIVVWQKPHKIVKHLSSKQKQTNFLPMQGARVQSLLWRN